MKKGSQILKLPVVNVDLNEKMGVVTGFVFDPDEKKVAALVIEPNVPMEGLRAVPMENVVSIYDTALMIENLEEPVNVSEDKPLLNIFLKDINLVGSMVASDEGKSIGVAREFVIDPAGGRILQINVRIRGGSGERVVDRDDIVRITADEIVVNTRPGQIVRGAPADAEKRKTDKEPGPKHIKAPADPAAARRHALEAEPHVEQPTDTEQIPESSKHIVEEIKKELRTELFALFETFFSDRIKGHFLEMARMILERINQAQPEEKLKALRNEIIGELSKIPEKEEAKEARLEELEEQADSLSLLVEEKIKQGAGSRLDSLASRLENIENTLCQIREKTDGATGDLQKAISKQAEALQNLPRELKLSDGTVDSLEPRIREAVSKIDRLNEGLNLLEPIAGKTDALKEQVANVQGEMISLREIQDSLRQTWMKITTGLGERFDTLESRFNAGESRDEEKSREFIEKISEIISSQSRGMPGKDELLSLTTKLETASARLKNLEEEAAGLAEEIIEKIDDSVRGLATELHAAVTRSTAPLVDNMKRSLEKRIEELKNRTETFKDEMGELQDVVRTSTMRMEKKLDERLAEEIDRLSAALSGISSSIPDSESIAGAMDGAIGSINETLGSLMKKMDAADEPLRERLEAQQKQAADELQKQTDTLLDRLREISGGLSTSADIQSLRESIGKAAETTARKMDEAVASLSVDNELNSFKEAVLSALNETSGKIEEQLETFVVSGDIENLKSSLSQSITEATGQLESRLSALVSKEEFGKLKDELLSPVKDESAELLKNIESATAENLAGLKGEIASTIKSVMQPLKSALEEIALKISAGEETASLKEDILSATNANVAKIENSFSEHVEGLKKSKQEILDAISPGLQTLLDRETDPGLAETLRNSMKTELETFKESIRPADMGPGLERLENEIEDLRNFVRQKVAEITDFNEIAREDTQKQLLSGIDDLFRKNVSDRLETFIAKHLDSSMAKFLEKIVSRPEATRGVLGRSRAREKPPAKSKASERPETATEKRLEYLIGRTVGKDLLDGDGSPIVAKGTVVDESLLSRMRENRRLLDLIQCIDFTQ